MSIRTWTARHAYALMHVYTRQVSITDTDQVCAAGSCSSGNMSSAPIGSLSLLLGNSRANVNSCPPLYQFDASCRTLRGMVLTPYWYIVVSFIFFFFFNSFLNLTIHHCCGSLACCKSEDKFAYQIFFPSTTFIFITGLTVIGNIVLILATLDPALSAESPSISPYATAFAGSVDATWTLQSSPPYTVLNLRALVNLPLGWRMYEQFYVRVLGSGGVNAAMAVMQATARAKRSRLSTAAGANLENNWSLAI